MTPGHIEEACRPSEEWVHTQIGGSDQADSDAISHLLSLMPLVSWLESA